MIEHVEQIKPTPLKMTLTQVAVVNNYWTFLKRFRINFIQTQDKFLSWQNAIQAVCRCWYAVSQLYFFARHKTLHVSRKEWEDWRKDRELKKSANP